MRTTMMTSPSIKLPSRRLLTFAEPRLRFAYDQPLEDPKEGLTLFGPPEKAQRTTVRGCWHGRWNPAVRGVSRKDVFDPSIVAESGASRRILELADSISELVDQLNKRHADKNGEDLFKATNKTAQALVRIRKVAKSHEQCQTLIDNLYFLFRESVGARLGDQWLDSFPDINDLRTDLRHDSQLRKSRKVRAKRRKIAGAFEKYAGGGTPDTMEPANFPLVQSNNSQCHRR